MIVREKKTIDGKEFTYTYSNLGLKIERDGEEYETALDPVETNHEYVETTEFAKEPTKEEYEEIVRILLGVEK